MAWKNPGRCCEQACLRFLGRITDAGRAQWSRFTGGYPWHLFCAHTHQGKSTVARSPVLGISREKLQAGDSNRPLESSSSGTHSTHLTILFKGRYRRRKRSGRPVSRNCSENRRSSLRGPNWPGKVALERRERVYTFLVPGWQSEESEVECAILIASSMEITS